MTTIFNKAVRDKIPELIKLSGKKANYTILESEEFLNQLELKLIEEITEYEKSKKIEELADVVEVIYNILRIKGTSKQEFERIREEKNKQKGSFKKNLFLIEVND